MRIAQFNIWEMSTKKLTDVDMNGIGQNDQLKAAAEVIRKVNPDVLMINEIDHDIDAMLLGNDYSLNAHRFNDAYLNQGENPLNYQFVYAAPCNTGFLSGKDFDNNGKVATEADRGLDFYGGDCYGYGAYPGQYSMTILSRYPLQIEKARTFQKFLWKDLPNNLIPPKWYSDDEIEIYRLSSKSHWDIPVKIGEKTIHLLLSHPTPSGYDEAENRKGRLNYDEIRMWVHYLNNDSVLVDDKGKRGGLAETESFIVAGDMNASIRGEILETGQRAIDQLLKHPRINDCGQLLVNKGALSIQMPGSPNYIERSSSGEGTRSSRVDHLLPSIDLKPINGGVYRPDATVNPEDAALAKKASDHRMIWLDFRLK